MEIVLYIFCKSLKAFKDIFQPLVKKYYKLYIAAFLCFAAAFCLSGCSSTVNISEAEDANNPLCAEIIVRLPNELAGLKKRKTSSQSTAAWGDPAAVILRCGIKLSENAALTCLSVDGVDFLIDDADDPTYRFYTYGRDVSTEIVIDSTKVSGNTVLSELKTIIENINAYAYCK